MKKLIFFTLMLIFNFSLFTNAKELPQQGDVPIDKVWNIKFNTQMDVKTVEDAITITDDKGNTFPITLSISEDLTTVLVTPVNKYKQDRAYTMTIKKEIRSLKGNTSSEDYIKKFTTSTGSESSIAANYLKSKNYNILQYNGQVDDYVLNKAQLLTSYIDVWSVQSVDAEKYIGKEIKVYQYIVNNHVLDNASNNENKSTLVYVMICNNEVIGGYSIPNYSVPVDGGVYSVDGKSLEEVTGMSYPEWLDAWEKKYNSLNE